ncbi:MAG TPA: nuclease [Cyanobacteria bacterium UBA11369]|nr:nuclease [Cyanobacteria bacterium UBA11371]HBE53077.1 nuclease [Cyanobacteria bacterium UBA11369]
MLDLTKVARQMQGISQHMNAETAASRKRLELATQLLLRSQAQQSELVERLQQWRDRLIFTAAVPVEPLDTRVEIPIPPKAHTVIATDGSQMAPSHHEIAYCYLINIGRVALHYGQSRHPFMDSLPEVFYKADDLNISRQWGIRIEEWLGYWRTASEAVALAELCTSWAKSQENGGMTAEKAGRNVGAGFTNQSPNPRDISLNPPLQAPARSTVPTLAMVDGSLIYWFLEQLPSDARDRILTPIFAAWEQIRAAGIPLIGYLSASRSSEAMNFLRLPVCPHPVPNCQTYCNNLDKLPCQVFDPLRDARFWLSQLQPGQRSPLWRSGAKILDLYGKEQSIYFCYVHVGAEIARIDMPAWVAEDAVMFDQALSLMLAQVQKGYGYPVTLAEAHNQAVVTGSDRARFFAMLEQQMIKAGLRNVGTSYKETRKRGSIA